MSKQSVATPVLPVRFHSYSVGGHSCNAFAIGDIGSADDFFLLGAEPREESPYPLLTGNIMDSDGKVLFRLVRNVLEVNDRECSKVVDASGYEIRDAAGAVILKVSTRHQPQAGNPAETFVTTLAGKFYDNVGRAVFTATSGSADETLESKTKAVFGLSGFGAFSTISSMTEVQIDIAKAVLLSGGANHRVLTGPIKDQTIELDRCALWDVQLSNCIINVRSANVSFIGSRTAFHSCEVNFFDGAAIMKNLIAHVLREGK